MASVRSVLNVLHHQNAIAEGKRIQAPVEKAFPVQGDNDGGEGFSLVPCGRWWSKVRAEPEEKGGT